MQKLERNPKTRTRLDETTNPLIFGFLCYLWKQPVATLDNFAGEVS